MSRVTHAVLCTGLVVFPASGQESQIVRYPTVTVELVGARTWTPAMIQDSLDRYSPGDSLHTHGCAATLRYRLGFAEAVAMRFLNWQGGDYVILAVVEPADSSRVIHRTIGFDTVGTRQGWAVALTAISVNGSLFQTAVRRYRRWLKDDQVPEYLKHDSAAVMSIWAFLTERRSAPDRIAALRVLRRDSNYYRRSVAAAILANFPQYDEVWRVLVDALREPDGPVRGVADFVLASFLEDAARPIDWRQSVESIHALLDGTGVASLATLLQVLNRTNIDSQVAIQALRGGGRMVLAFAGAEHPHLNRPALDFLRRVSGQDYGDDTAGWAAWLHSQ